MSGYRSPWAILGIGETDDERAVKRAYSAKLKEMDVEADPQGFIALRAAFDQARNIAIWRTEQKAEAERREAEGLNNGSLDQDWEDEDWEDDWQSGPPPAAYAHERQSAAAEANGPAATHPKIDGVEIDLSLASDAFIASPFAAPHITITDVSLADGLSANLAEPPNADQQTSEYYGPAFQGLSNVIALHLVPISETAGSGALPLALPAQPLAQVFPDRTPLYASFFGYGKRTKPAASDLPALDAFADLESEGAEPSQVEATDLGDATDTDAADTQVWPSAIDLDTSSYVSFTRDDWGNADRERIAQLLYDRHFGPAEASEVERLANRLFASPHMDELDYRDWIENWCANLISETSPRSDGMLELASKVFGWGTDADKLYHDYAVGRCVARNRDLDAIRQMQDPDNRWHPQYTLLQQPAPASISWWSRRKWQEVQTFIDNVRANRPTVEWDLDPEHVALWDKLIDARLWGPQQQSGSGLAILSARSRAERRQA